MKSLTIFYCPELEFYSFNGEKDEGTWNIGGNNSDKKKDWGAKNCEFKRVFVSRKKKKKKGGAVLRLGFLEHIQIPQTWRRLDRRISIYDILEP